LLITPLNRLRIKQIEIELAEINKKINDNPDELLIKRQHELIKKRMEILDENK
jgi:hypothetical protein